MQRRASTARLVIAPDGKRQPDFETLMQEDDLTAAFPDTAKTFYKKDQQWEEVTDCSGEEVYKKILLGEVGEIKIAFDVSAKWLVVLYAYTLGVAAAPTGTSPKTHQLNELPVGSYQPSPFSLVHGFVGVANPLILRGCTMHDLKVASAARRKVTAEATIKFAEATEATGFTLPACVNYVPLRFSDCSLLKGATDLTSGLRRFEYLFSNNLLTGDHAFTDGGTVPTRLERADRRTRALRFAVLGDDKDALYTEAKAGDEDSFTLHIGPVGARVSVLAPQACFELDGGGLQKDGEAAETHIPVVATPEIVSGNANSPTNVVAVNDQATAYLVAST